MKTLLKKLLGAFFASLAFTQAYVEPVDWIGRVNYAGYSVRSHCTGAVIAPNMVLTAAHCLISGRTGKPFEPENVIFRAGYHLGESKADIKGRSFIFMKGYLDAKTKSEKIILDASIVVLESDLDIKPAKVSALRSDQDKFRFMGYSVAKPHALTHSENCNRTTPHSSVIVVDCKAQQGQSGSPLISELNDEIVGLVVGINAQRQAIILNLSQLGHLEPYLFKGKKPDQ